MKRLLILALWLPVTVWAANTNSFHNLSTSNLISTGAITLNGGALTVSNNTLKLNGSAVTGGTHDHSALTNLAWTASGHTGTVGRIAGFLEGGAAGYIIPGSNLELDGSDNLNVTGLVTAAQLEGATNTATLAASGVLTNYDAREVAFTNSLRTQTIYLGGNVAMWPESHKNGSLVFYDKNTEKTMTLRTLGGAELEFVGDSLPGPWRITFNNATLSGNGVGLTNVNAATLGGVAVGGLVQTNRQLIAGANITVNGGASAPLTGDVTIASTGGAAATSNITAIVADYRDWTWGAGGNSASNAIVPVYWTQTTAAGDQLALGWTSSSTATQQDRFAYTALRGIDSATGWASETAACVWVLTSSPSVLTSWIASVRFTAPDGSQFTTNNLVSSAANTWTPICILTNSLGAWQNNGTGTNRWTVRVNPVAWQSQTAAVAQVEFNVKVVK